MNQKEKLLHNIAAKYIMNEDVNIELSGNYAEMECLQQLLEISRHLKESLDKDVPFNKVIELLKEKKNITKKFENLSGITWRL
jgi:hypothetical protein